MDPALAADLILILHAGFIAFVVLGLVLTLIGACLGWRWVRNFWFRIAHLLAILVVALQAWLGWLCPLTEWEAELRVAANGRPYPEEGFIAYWLHELIYYDFPFWAFTLAYTLFALAVLATLIFLPPRPPGFWRRIKSRTG